MSSASSAPGPHPDFDLLASSWELSLRAEDYSNNSVDAYLRGLRSLRDWATEHRPGRAPDELDRNDIRGWLVWMRDVKKQAGSGRYLRFVGARMFYRWSVEEGEQDTNPFDGLTAPQINKTSTPTVKPDQMRQLLAACTGRDFLDRRNNAVLRLFYDSGLRLSENASLLVDSVDLTGRMIYIVGKGSRRRGPKKRAVPFGIQTARALDRYLRERRKMPYADTETRLWLTPSGTALTVAGLKAMVDRLGAKVGIPDLHPHMLRHSWASAGRKAGMSEGDMMYLGGWSKREMLDRYGAVETEERAQEAYRGRSVGDQL